jgi:type 1 fimbria pilin
MTKYNAQLVSGLALIISAFIPPAFSATVVDGGVIHFRGAIVAEALLQIVGGDKLIIPFC